MTEEQAKEIMGRLDEISNSLINLDTFFTESGLKSNLSSIAESLKKIAENYDSM